MIEVVGDLWTYPADWRVITTNGTIKKDGSIVMGRGCASEAKEKYPKLPKLLGDFIKLAGNIPCSFPEHKLITFPVKHNWWEKADPQLIKKSITHFQEIIALHYPQTEIVMPRPGCGNGGLKWEDVKPLLESLTDNVKVITHDPNSNRT